MREKEQKRGLEEQIMKLTSQMISTERPTGEDVGDGDVRRSITVKSQGRTNTALEIDNRLADLERERECIEHVSQRRRQTGDERRDELQNIP